MAVAERSVSTMMQPALAEFIAGGLVLCPANPDPFWSDWHFHTGVFISYSDYPETIR
jgi:hypothetical protein